MLPYKRRHVDTPSRRPQDTHWTGNTIYVSHRNNEDEDRKMKVENQHHQKP